MSKDFLLDPEIEFIRLSPGDFLHDGSLVGTRASELENTLTHNPHITTLSLKELNAQQMTGALKLLKEHHQLHHLKLTDCAFEGSLKTLEHILKESHVDKLSILSSYGKEKMLDAATAQKTTQLITSNAIAELDITGLTKESRYALTNALTGNRFLVAMFPEIEVSESAFNKKSIAQNVMHRLGLIEDFQILANSNTSVDTNPQPIDPDRVRELQTYQKSVAHCAKTLFDIPASRVRHIMRHHLAAIAPAQLATP